MILAISAILVANVSAQEVNQDSKAGKPSKEERLELDIKRLSNELMLSDKQAEKFAVTYREYAAEVDRLLQLNAPKDELEPDKQLTDKELDMLAKRRFENVKELANVQLKFYDRFRKNLSARQVAKVMQFNDPFACKSCCGKHDGKHIGKHDPHRQPAFEHRAPRPQSPEAVAPRPQAPEAAAPSQQKQ